MPPEFNEVAFSLKKGELSEIVLTKHGCHIIKVLDRKPEGIDPYEEVRNFISKLLQEGLVKRNRDSYIKELKSKAEIEILLMSLNMTDKKEKRTCHRIHVRLDASIFCEPYFFRGTITDLSEKGICINAAMCFPCGTRFKLFIHEKEKFLEIVVQVKRSAKRQGFNEAMGLELLNPSQGYIEFFNGLRSAVEVY